MVEMTPASFRPSILPRSVSFVQQLGRFGHAEVQRFIVDIFHDDRYAFPCRLVSDTAAHNTRAQYGCLFRRLNIFGQLLALPLHIDR